MGLKEILCNVKAIPWFIRYGVWCPHIYKDVDSYITHVFASNNGFRESSDYLHADNEKPHLNATVTVSRCIYCDKILKTWYDEEPRKLYVNK